MVIKKSLFFQNIDSEKEDDISKVFTTQSHQNTLCQATLRRVKQFGTPADILALAIIHYIVVYHPHT